MNMDALSQELVDPVFTCTVSSSGHLKRNPKRDRANYESEATSSKSAKKYKQPSPTMLVVAYANIIDLADNKKNQYVVVVDKMLPVVDGVKVDVFNSDDTFYNIPSAPMGIDYVMDIKDYSFTVFTRENKRRVKLSLYGGKQLYDCSVDPSSNPKGWLVRGYSSSGGTQVKAFVDVHKLPVQGEEQTDYLPAMPRGTNPDLWHSVKRIADEILMRHESASATSDVHPDGVEEVKEAKEQDLHCTII